MHDVIHVCSQGDQPTACDINRAESLFVSIHTKHLRNVVLDVWVLSSFPSSIAMSGFVHYVCVCRQTACETVTTS